MLNLAVYEKMARLASATATSVALKVCADSLQLAPQPCQEISDASSSTFTNARIFLATANDDGNAVSFMRALQRSSGARLMIGGVKRAAIAAVNTSTRFEKAKSMVARIRRV